MAIGRNESIAALYAVTTGKKAADITASDLEKWMSLDSDVTLETINASMLKQQDALTYPSNPVELVKSTFLAVFGYTPDVTVDGFQYWVDQLNNKDYINADTLAIALMNGAADADAAKVNAYATPLVTAYEAASSVETEHLLTSGTDVMTATGISVDNFKAYIQQNSFAGGVSNSLSSADRLDGGDGADTLYAELTNEFVGVDGAGETDVQPRTTSIETVQIEARDADNAAGTVITLDAKYMTGINSIGSKMSDGDLKIENLTTLSSTGEIRHTSAMTITMDHTDNFDSDGDASDLTVLFDEDYLNTTTSTQGSSLTLRINNVINIKEGNNPVDGFATINFTVGTTPVSVDVTGSTSYDDIVSKINAELNTLGLTTVSASKANSESVYFSQLTVTTTNTYNANDYAGEFNPVTITNTGSEVLTKGIIDLAQGTIDGDINNTWSSVDASQTTNPISINIELNKVGRDGEGGNLIVGGKDQNLNGDSDVDQNDGINVFNISVEGDNDKPSNLGTITSTNNSLTTVYVKDGATWSGADLTVRSILGQGQELTTIDATGFSGDFSLASKEGANDTATAQQALSSSFGSGNDTYDWMNTSAANVDTDKDYYISMGSGNDTVTANLDGDTVDAIGESFNLVTGEGNDTVTLNMAAGVSYNTMSEIGSKQATYLDINTGNGNDRVMLNDYGTFDIVTGAGNDYIEIDANSATTNTGTTTIFANTGADSFARVLYDAKMTVSFAGFETTIDINTTSATNFVATQELIASEIKRAIESDDTLKEFLTVTINAGTNQVTITSDVEGDQSFAIAIYQPELIAAGTPTASQALIASQDVGALRKGLLATETVAGLSATLEDANEIATWTNTNANNWEGQVDQTGLANNAVTYTSAQLTHDTAEAVHDDNADLLDNATFLGYTTLGSEDSTIVNFSTIDAGAGDDIIVLDSNELSMNTIVVSGQFGNDKVVNFFDQATSIVTSALHVGDHRLDFSTFLNDKVDTSGAGNISGTDNDSATLADTNVILAGGRSFADAAHGATAGAIIDANDVAIIRFDSSVAASAETFANLSAADLVNALNGDFDTTAPGDSAYGNINVATLEAAAQANYVSATQNHIIMVENDLNEGEYKVFHVTSTIDTTATSATYGTVASGDFNTSGATLLGTFDFGASVNLAIAQEESVKAAFSNALLVADNVSLTPSVSISTITAQNENTAVAIGETIATASVAHADANAIISYALSGTEAANYAIDASTGVITVATGYTPDYETDPSYDFNVVATVDGVDYMAAASIAVNDILETPGSTTTRTESVTAANTTPYDATTADVTFNITAGTYTYTIDGFGAGDVLNFPDDVTPTIINDSFTDNSVIVQYASSGNVVQVTLTGLASDTINSAADLDTTFGAGTLI